MSDLIDILRLYLERQNAALEQIAKNEAQLVVVLQEMSGRIAAVEEKLKVVEVLKWIVMALLATVVWVVTGRFLWPPYGT